MKQVGLSAWPLLAIAFVALGGVRQAAGAVRRPNVILIMSDDQGYGDFSCHGNPVLKTPHLDRLHSESVRLTDFHVCPMCTPTRGQLLTGCDALRNGAMNVSSGRTMLRREFPTLADAFRGSGYRTGQFGKWHLGDNAPYRPHERGFDEAVFFPSSHIGSAPDYWNNDYFDDYYRHRDRLEPFQGYCTDVFFGEARRWIRENAKRPFFAYIATNTPHGPLFVPDRYREPYRAMPPNVASFFGMIANLDENVGKLDELLRELGIRDDTLLIYLTDNGGTAGVGVHNAGLRGRKIDLYDGGHRVPCFLRWPKGGLGGAKEIGDLTLVQDLMPSLIELCGLKRPAGPRFDGISLAARLRGETGTLPERTAVIQFSRMNEPRPRKGDAAVLRGKWRLVNDSELYHLAEDPGQTRDVAYRHPEVLAGLRAHYERWWSDVAPRVNEFSPIHLTRRERETTLSAADWEDSFLDQGRQVRQGLRRSGAWNLFVEEAGEYDIALRRWPEEANTPIAVGLPPYRGVDGVYPAGEALPIVQARLRLAGKVLERPVGGDDRAAGFRVRLPKGPQRVEGLFLGKDGQEIAGAYYATVRRR